MKKYPELSEVELVPSVKIHSCDGCVYFTGFECKEHSGNTDCFDGDGGKIYKLKQNETEISSTKEQQD